MAKPSASAAQEFVRRIQSSTGEPTASSDGGDDRTRYRDAIKTRNLESGIAWTVRFGSRAVAIAGRVARGVACTDPLTVPVFVPGAGFQRLPLYALLKAPEWSNAERMTPYGQARPFRKATGGANGCAIAWTIYELLTHALISATEHAAHGVEGAERALQPLEVAVVTQLDVHDHADDRENEDDGGDDAD